MHCSNGRKRKRSTHGSFPRLHAFCGCSFGLFGKRNLPGVRTSINVSPKTVWRIKTASANADSGISPSKCWRLSRKTHASPSGRGRRRSCPSTLLLANIWIRHKPRRHLAFSFIPMTGGMPQRPKTCGAGQCRRTPAFVQECCPRHFYRSFQDTHIP